MSLFLFKKLKVGFSTKLRLLESLNNIMENQKEYKRKDGMVLIDNYWIEESNLERHLSQRAEATQKAIEAMETFCESVRLQWSGSEDGEAIVGYNTDQSIRSVIHLNPYNIALILSKSPNELIDYLK